MSADGSGVDPFGPFIACPSGAAYSALDNNLYVGRYFDGGIQRIGLDGSDLGTTAPNVFQPTELRIGRSGTIYVATTFGEIWTVEAAGEGDAQLLGFTPSNPWGGLGMAVVEGALVMSGLSFGEFYSFPVDDGPVGTQPGLITVRLAPENIVNLGGLAKSIPGEDFRIPLNMEISADATAVANYTLELGWDVARLEFLDLAQGDFTTGPGSFVANTAMVSEGSLVATGAEPEGRGAGGAVFTLFTLDLVVDESLVAGDVVAVAIDATEVGGALNEDLLPVVVVVPGAICLSLNPMGDVTLNGQASAADATQILRFIVGLPLAPDIDLDRGDVTGDGTVGVGDVVDILRNLVGLPVPASSRVDKPPLESCS
ncbi:MAG: hypothetical protein IIA44_08130 [Acidobacteria bacterium]|nr:hypothetical protein [Acidobacteriota bacterium]